MDKEAEATYLLSAYKMMMTARRILAKRIKTHGIDLAEMELRHALKRLENVIKKEHPEAWEQNLDEAYKLVADDLAK